MTAKPKPPSARKTANASLQASTSGSIAQRFTEEVRRLGLTQVELAARTGISKVAVSNYARGHRLPAIDVLLKIDELGGDMRYILTGRPASQPTSTHLDIQRFGLAFDEAQRQSTLNGEDLTPKALFERAWVIYQAWNAMMPSAMTKVSKADDVTSFTAS